MAPIELTRDRGVGFDQIQIQITRTNCFITFYIACRSVSADHGNDGNAQIDAGKVDTCGAKEAHNCQGVPGTKLRLTHT